MRDSKPNYCYSCMTKEGYKPKDEGAHTATKKVCDKCGETKTIRPTRHWK